MNEDNEIKKAISDIVKVSKRLSRVSKPNQNVKTSWLNEIASKIWSSNYENLIRSHAEKGRSFLGSLKRYNQNPENYLRYVLPHANAIENYIKENPQFSKKYGWDTPLIATRYRIPGSEETIGIDDVIRKNKKTSDDTSSASAPPVSPPSTPPPTPPISNPPPSPDNDDDGKNKDPKKWGVYKHNFTNLLEGFNPEDYKKKSGKDDKSLKAEKDNTKGVNENTKALTGLRSFLGPYAKAIMPFYGAKMFYDLTKSDTSASLARVNRRTFGGLYGASGSPRRGYRRVLDSMTSYGASEQDVMREYAGQKKWASTLMFGMGLDKIEALAMVLGKAPGPAEMRDPELMQKWLRENMRGITDMQAMQLSAMGVASDTFIESARKGQAVDTEGETARIHSRYKTLYDQQGGWENPFRKLQFGIGRDNANALAEGGLTGFIYEFEMDVLRKLGNVWGALFSKNETGTSSPRDEYSVLPNQTSVTVNINGNIDSEERAHSFAEQIGAEVSNAEK